MNNQEVYSSWKPLRNHLSKLGIRDSLEAIWWYSWYIPFDAACNSPRPLPYMSYDSRVLRNSKYPLLTWELEMLAEEVILNGRDFVLSPDESLKNGRKFNMAMRKLKNVNQVASKLILSGIENALDMFFPLTHQQFKYQGHSHDDVAMIRYYHIWSDNDVAEIIQKRLGMNVKELFTANFLIFSCYMNSPAIDRIDANSCSFGVSGKKAQMVIDMIAKPWLDIRGEIAGMHRLDETYEYQYNPLMAHPLIDFGKKGSPYLVCPIPLDLQLRLLNGLYYDLCNENRFSDGYDFGNALGNSFQRYVGEILLATLDNSTIYPEEKELKKKCDWIIDQDKSFLLVECKIKRPSMKSYTNILDLEPLDGQLDILADAVVQAYEAYTNYKHSNYKTPHYQYDDTKKASICVVTMEDWCIISNTRLKLEEKVKEKLKQRKLSNDLLVDVPFIVMSVGDFEEFSYCLKEYDSYELISKHCTNLHGYAIGAIKDLISDKEFLKAYEYAFRGQFGDCFTMELEDILNEIEDTAFSNP